MILDSLSGLRPYGLILVGSVWVFLFFQASPAQAESKRLSQSDFERIDLLLGQAQYDKAIELTKRLELKHPDQKAQLQGERAMLLMYKGEDRAASELAASVLKADPKNHEAHWVLSNIYMKQGRSKDGSREYEMSLKNPSKRPCKPCAMSKLRM